MVTNDRWLQAHEDENDYWKTLLQDPKRIEGEDAFYRYAPVLGLDTDNVNGKQIIDIGGGPLSILYHFDCPYSDIVDPLVIPEEFKHRYIERKLFYIQRKAEDFIQDFLGDPFDEVWMYNCLLHVQDPKYILYNLSSIARVLRIGEPMGTGINTAHPHTFTVEQMTEWLMDISKSQRFLSRQYDYLYFGGVFELK